MNDTKNIVERERTAKLIAKTRESIRKKHRALKTGIMESEIALEKKFKLIVEPLRQIVDITERDKPSEIRDVVKVKTSKGKLEHSDNDDDDDNDDVISKKIKQNRSPLKEQSLGQVTLDAFTGVAPVKWLRTPQGRDRLNSQLGPLGHIYINALLSGDKRNEIDHVYGVYFDENGTMLGDKKFDVDTDDTIIIDGKIVKSNKGYKYKCIIGPLVSAHRTMSLGAGVPTTMRVTDDKVDYVHWDDPNKLVDRLQLLDASRTTGNNAHDNEILSILEELREAGVIIN
ncbi:hypothetical protein ALC62_08623 [Cyphomyrmex costatus]|uniref:DUF8207 domain-containing protein n=1 Tax=Cyphomyrmex costatus TaxID=456900 RepID=A0A151IGJ2_9HYME|nr:hypothetical protein ALC62_08623 [Cyphomyrmex costatus]